jgi:hypothetical protein
MYAIPTHIDFDVATGQWSVITSGEGTREQLPDWVGVYSIWQGERCEGVRFVPTTVGFERMVVSWQRWPGRQITDSTQVLEVPDSIQFFHDSWHIAFADKRVSATDAEIRNSIGCLWMRVPLHGVGKQYEDRGSGIKNQAMER